MCQNPLKTLCRWVFNDLLQDRNYYLIVSGLQLGQVMLKFTWKTHPLMIEQRLKSEIISFDGCCNC